MGAYRNIVSWERTSRPQGRFNFLGIPVARFLMGKALGDVVGVSGQELEIIAIS